MNHPSARERDYSFSPEEHRDQLVPALREIVGLAPQGSQGPLPQTSLHRILRRYPKGGRGFFSRAELIAGFAVFADEVGADISQEQFMARMRMRPVRSHSGVTPITVLSKPFPCPGQCVFCPNDVRMPKSYLSDEPGCQRAEQNGFDPYLQTFNRMAALAAIGHNVDKVELIVLGGTWSFYPEPYQIWFIQRCFEAMNDFGGGRDGRARADRERFQIPDRESRADSRGEGAYNRAVDKHLRLLGEGERLRGFERGQWTDLQRAHQENEEASCRCVGLVLETRPDHVDAREIRRLRRLGCTKVQLGYQTLNDDVLAQNKRGHGVAEICSATALLKDSGFKVLAHFMPNLLGATPALDIEAFRTMFDDAAFRPDELKVYPCSLIEHAELMDFYERGEWAPYSQQDLLEVLCEVIARTPRFCRLSRVIRDICAGDIVVGNRQSNFREVAERELDARGIKRSDIRSREVGGVSIAGQQLSLRMTRYEASEGTEAFIEFVTDTDRVAGFCRLRLPRIPAPVDELQGQALIRELHIYGVAQGLGRRQEAHAQHRGLGTELLEAAARVAVEAGYKGIAVISAVGTRNYYRTRGFVDGELYQHRQLTPDLVNR